VRSIRLPPTASILDLMTDRSITLLRFWFMSGLTPTSQSSSSSSTSWSSSSSSSSSSSHQQSEDEDEDEDEDEHEDEHEHEHEEKDEEEDITLLHKGRPVRSLHQWRIDLATESIT
jgi:hypothetical protein